MATGDATRTWRSRRPVALMGVLGVFRRGAGDPSFLRSPDGSVTRAMRTPEGVAALELHCAAVESTVTARAWGPGAEWAVAQAPELLGESDDPSGFAPRHPALADAARRFPGWRVPRSALVLEALVPAVIEQKVAGEEAFGGYRTLLRRFGQPAPGPWGERGLVVAPSARQWATLPSWDYLRARVDPRRSATVVRAAHVAGRLESLVSLDPEQARSRLRLVPGVGVWTAAEVAQRALGDADAVSFGDYHVARDIGWALTGAPLDDDGLAELLEPYAGHRYRVQRLLELAGAHLPRRGPRLPRRTHLPG
ncbi:MAG: DNA-3-methyladenine glycosylase family protein [Dermatophilaceae bacterium]